MIRRNFMQLTATSGFAAISKARDWSGHNPVRYPDPDVKAMDSRFNKYRLGNAAIRRIYSSPICFGLKAQFELGGKISSLERYSQQQAIKVVVGRWSSY